MIDRRTCITHALGSLAALGTVTAGGPARAAAGLAAVAGMAGAGGSTGGAVAAAHVLNRLGFGPRPGDLESVGADPRGWVAAQLAPRTLPLPAALAGRADEAAFVDVDPTALVRDYFDLIDQDNAARNAAGAAAPMEGAPTRVGRFVREQQAAAIEARLVRALLSPRQLEEVMVDFWFNHFNVYREKSYLRVLMGHYEHYAIRPFAMGRFRDLLGATAHHPAMLFYLDNWQSAGGRGLNENYARELMELHTLGVDGGYTQADVTALARMFTGWSIVPARRRGPNVPEVRVVPPGQPEATPGFWFNPRLHDRGDKQWLGVQVAALGKAEGDQALDRLAAHPATARHIGFKLAQYFVADRPDPALVERLAGAFSEHDGEIVPVLRVLFDSEAFWAPAHRGNKFKTPYHYTVSALRATGAPPGTVLAAATQIGVQGMALFACPTPDGYRNTEAAWLNPDAVAKRINLATLLAAGRLGAAAGATPVDATALLPVLGPLVEPATREQMQRHGLGTPLAAALALAGPGMMWR